MKQITFFFFISLFFSSVLLHAQPCPDSSRILYASKQDICFGDTGKVTIEESETGVTYKAMINTTIVSNGVNGGDTIELVIPSNFLKIGKNKIRVVAYKPGCPAVLLTLSTEIFVHATAQTSKFSIELDKKYACPATPVKIIGYQVDPYNIYELYINDIKQNGGLDKDGDFWLFPGFYDVQYVRVEETITNDCGQGKFITYDTIFVIQPNIHQYVTADTPCYGGKATIQIYDSEPDYNYVVITSDNFSNVISDTLVGNGGILSMHLQNRLYSHCNTTIKVFSLKNTQCERHLSNSPVIFVHNLGVDFTTSFSGGAPGEVFTIINNSTADSMLWNIDGTPSTKFTPDPLTFNTTGMKNIKLIGYTPSSGCHDTISKNIEIVNASPKAAGIACEYLPLEKVTDWIHTANQKAYSFHIDKQGNKYIAYSTLFSSGAWWSGGYGLTLRKYDKNNKLLWEKKHDPVTGAHFEHEFYANFLVDMDSDEAGNLYIVGHFAGNHFEWNNMKLTYNQTTSVGYLIKLNADGIVQWIIHSDNKVVLYNETTSFTDLIYVNDNEIYASLSRPKKIQFPDNTILMYDSTDIMVMKINKDGKLLKEFSSQHTPESYLMCEFNPNASAYVTPRTALLSPKMAITSIGKIVITGKSNDMIPFGNLSYLSKRGHSTQFVAVLDPLYGWEKVYNAYSYNWFQRPFLDQPLSIAPLFTLDSKDNIYLTDYFDTQYERTTVSINGTNEILRGWKGAFTAKYSLNGNLKWFDSTTVSVGKGMVNIKDEILVYGYYNNNYYATGSTHINRIGMRNRGLYDIFLTSYSLDGKINWVEPIASDTFDLSYLITTDHCAENAYFCGLTNRISSFLKKDLSLSEFSFFVGKYSPASICECTITDLNDRIDKNIFISAYPNPASDKLMVTSADPISEITIRNMLGETVLTTRIMNGNLNELIDISYLPPAAYLIHVKMKTTDWNEKIFIIR